MLARLPLMEAHQCLTSACDLSPWEGGVAVPGRNDACASGVHLLIGRVLGVFVLPLQQVFRERQGLGVQLLGFAL